METRDRGTLRALALLLVVALVAACDEEKSSGGGSGGTSSSGGSGLACYADDPCGLMSADDVRAVVADLPADAKHTTGNRSLHVCQYSWPSDRKASRTVAGRTIEYGVDNLVCLKWIRKVRGDDPVRSFRNAYRTMTEEEKAKAKEAFEKALAEKVESGEVSRDGSRLGASMTGSMFDSLRFESVDGVGTAAAWGGTKGSIGLKVLDGSWEFEVVADVSADEAKNREAAIALAKRILANAR